MMTRNARNYRIIIRPRIKRGSTAPTSPFGIRYAGQGWGANS